MANIISCVITNEDSVAGVLEETSLSIVQELHRLFSRLVN